MSWVGGNCPGKGNVWGEYVWGGSSVGRISEWGVKIEAPKAPRGVGCGEGVSPYPLGEGSAEGAVPPPQKNFAFFASKSRVFDALWHPFEVILK